MKVAEKIEKQIGAMPDGATFTYQGLSIAPEEYTAATKAIERLNKKGIISRASTGLFYKPKKTSFGNLKPKEEELLKPYLFEGNKRVAYVTGTALYNRMGVTTQVPKSIQVASRNKRIVTKVGNVEVKPVKSYTDVTNDNYYLMELLDVLKDFKTIPDTKRGEVIEYMLNRFKSISMKERYSLVKIALKYPPRVRALAGALLNQLSDNVIQMELKKSINPLTVYEFGIDKVMLSNIEYWNIR